MLRNVVIGIVVLLLLAGGVFGYIYLNNTTPDAEPQEEGEFGVLFPASGERELPPESVATSTDLGSTAAGEATTTTRLAATLPASSPFFGTRGGRDYIRYFESQTGHLYEIGTTERIPIKLSNTTIPGIREVLWNSTGSAFILRRPNAENGLIETFRGRLVFATSSTSDTTNLVGEIQGEVYPKNLSEISVSPDNTKIFYLLSNQNGTEGFLSDFDNKAVKKIFSSPLREWNVEWTNTEAIILTTRASNEVPGTAVALNSTTGKASTLIPAENGLITKAHPSRNYLFTLITTDRGFKNYIYHPTLNLFDDFPFYTLPEKCTWSTRKPENIFCAMPETIVPARYPDVWYQGRVSFDDSIWKVDAINGGATLIYDPQAQGVSVQPIDAVNLLLNTTEDRLYFTDKNTGHLRFIEIPEETLDQATASATSTQ